MNQKLLLLVGLIAFACNPTEKEVRPKDANMVCENFYIQGQFKNDIYTFCGTFPQEIPYQFKYGNWKYWNLEGQLIAEGIYKTETRTIEDEGGCPYEILEGKIDKENWRFWNENGKQIVRGAEIITQLNLCSEILIP